MIDKDDYIFFWGGIYSQWYMSDFRVGKVTYNCAEQYMMAQKALLFNDTEAFEAIMISNNPRNQKAIGRQVRNFEVVHWTPVCRSIVFEANLAKFQQNDDLYEELMATGNKQIVEASPEDCIWGIGLSEMNEDRFDKSKWRGTNWLGEEIMNVRARLRMDKGYD